MKLLDLDPRWFVDKEGRQGMGVSFICPHCLKTRLGVDFANPIDGGTPMKSREYTNNKGVVKMTTHWHREGTTFETLTLSPSIDASETDHWHGFICNGEVS